MASGTLHVRVTQGVVWYGSDLVAAVNVSPAGVECGALRTKRSTCGQVSEIAPCAAPLRTQRDLGAVSCKDGPTPHASVVTARETEVLLTNYT